MATLDGISLDVCTRLDGLAFTNRIQISTSHVSRTILSSVGGFSEPNREVGSFRDLLATIQHLKLPVFQRTLLKHEAFIGEGVSYKVSRCFHTQTNALYAVKQVKLPSKTDIRAFNRQVACVLRDVEVMSWMKAHENILNIVGYGWNVEENNIIPFLVTELAPMGTLRQYLKASTIPTHEKLLFCKDIAEGLHALHKSGIAHGDIKLDNILVAQGTQYDQWHAAIADFGHSLHLYDSDGEHVVEGRYGGTLVYNAPEIVSSRSERRDDINFRKCDVWSLGLLCWEALQDGIPYYQVERVQEAVITSQALSASSQKPSTQDIAQSSISFVLRDVSRAAPYLATIAAQQIPIIVTNDLTLRELEKLAFLFEACLAYEPNDRVADINLLPLFSRTRNNFGATERFQVNVDSNWSFEVLAKSTSIPQQVKSQILQDCLKMANEPGTSLSSARAAFQAGFCYQLGFGGSRDSSQASQMFSKSASKGLKLAEIFSSVLAPKPDVASDHDSCMECFHNAVVSGYRHYWAYQIFPSLSKAAIDAKLRNDKEFGLISLFEAFKMGRFHRISELIGRAEEFRGFGTDGTSPLHWIFMLKEEEIGTIGEIFTAPLDIGFVAINSEDTDHLIPNNPQEWNQFAIKPIVIDPQLPFSVVGTPLSFAVATCNTKAVRFLLDAGADPLAGTYHWRETIFNESPIQIACRYHLAGILDMLLQRVFPIKTSDQLLEAQNLETKDKLRLEQMPLMVELLDALTATLCSASLTERELIHQKFTAKAARNTVRIFYKYYDDCCTTLDSRIFKILRPAIEAAEVETAECIMETAYRRAVPDSLVLSQGDEVVRLATIAACDACPDLERAKNLLSFVSSLGLSLTSDKTKNYSQTHPLFIAIQKGQPSILDWLLEHGAVADVEDEFGSTPLHKLLSNGNSIHYDIKKLIAAGNPVLDYDTGGKNLLDYALKEDTATEFGILLSYERDPVRISSFLDQAISMDSPVLVDEILRYATNLKVSTRQNYNFDSLEYLTTCLQRAIADSSGLVIKSIVTHMLVKDDPLGNQDTWNAALELAVTQANSDAVDILLKSGASPNHYISTTGKSLLESSIGVAFQHFTDPIAAFACFELLLEAGAALNDPRQQPPVSLICSIPKNLRPESLVQKLIEHGADWMVPSGRYSDCLSQAIVENNEVVAKLICNRSDASDLMARVNANILHFLAKHHPQENVQFDNESPWYILIAKAAIKSGCDVYQEDSKFNSSFRIAAQSNNYPLLIVLLEEHLAISKRNAKATLLKPPNSSGLSVGKKWSSSRLSWNGIQNLLKNKGGHTTTPLDDMMIQEMNSGANESLAQRQLVHNSWLHAVRLEHWAACSAFIQSGFLEDKDETFDSIIVKGLDLLFFAAKKHLRDVLIRFMGHAHDSSIRPIRCLERVWARMRLNLKQMKLDPSLSKIKMPFSERVLMKQVQETWIYGLLSTYVELDGFTEIIPVEYRESCGFLEYTRESNFPIVVEKQFLTTTKPQIIPLKFNSRDRTAQNLSKLGSFASG